MTISVRWMNKEQTLIELALQEPWTWEEVDRAWKQYHGMAASVMHRIHTVVDVSELRTIPNNAMQIAQTRYMELPENVDLYIMIGAPMMLRAIIDVLKILSPMPFSHYRFVPTYQEAYRLINSPVYVF